MNKQTKTFCTNISIALKKEKLTDSKISVNTSNLNETRFQVINSMHLIYGTDSKPMINLKKKPSGM
jgi:hypothetical protein